MTQKNIKIMESIVDEMIAGKTLSKALKTVYTKRNVAIPFIEESINVPIDALKMSNRTTNALLRHRIKTVRDAIECCKDGGVKRIKNFGSTCGTELFEAILDWCWSKLNKEARVDFLIDTVIRNEYYIIGEELV